MHAPILVASSGHIRQHIKATQPTTAQYGLSARLVPWGRTRMLRRSLLLSGVVFAVPLHCWLGHRAAVAMATGATVSSSSTSSGGSGASGVSLPPTSDARHLGGVSGVSPGQERLVEHLISEGLVRRQAVADALLSVDRAAYVNPAYVDPEREAYQDRPLLNGAGQTISAPHMHAICLELLADHLAAPGSTALDVGSGSGYLTAAMAQLAAPRGGRVLGVEQVASLVEAAQAHVSAANPQLLEGPEPALDMRVLNVLAEDVEQQLEGWAPFDAIHVGAAAAALPPALVALLKPGGRMIIPVGEQDRPQTLLKVDKRPNGSVVTERMLSVGYVPLTPPHQGSPDGSLLWVDPF